jgi:hypothetical protein
MENQATEGQTTTVEATPAAQEKMIPESRLNNLIQQVTELKKFKESVDLEAKAAAEKKAIEAQEFEKVLASREAEKAELAAKVAQLEKQTVLKDVTNALIVNGATDDLVRDGLITRFEREQPADVAAWIAAQKTAHPQAFTAAPIPMSSNPVGNAAAGKQASSLETRLLSTDPKIKMEALKEQFRLEATGKL